ncbi:TolC family protein, partial [Stutzerimonas stutzeri]
MNWIVQPLPVRSWGLLAPVILGLALSSGAQASPGSAELGATLPP